NDDGGDRLAGTLHGDRDLGEAAGDQLPLTHKGGKALNHPEFPERPHGLSFIPGYNSPVNITRVISRLAFWAMADRSPSGPRPDPGTPENFRGMPMLTVHHLNNSRSQRVLWLLEELGVPYEIVRYQRQPDMRAPKELRAIHPLGKSPVITANGNTIAES